MTLFAVNATLDEVVRPLDFSAFGDHGQEVSVWTLADRQKAGEPDVTNSFGEPERVSPVGVHVPGGRAAVRLSISALVVDGDSVEIRFVTRERDGVDHPPFDRAIEVRSCSSLRGSTGLTMWWSKPARTARCRSFASPWPVMATSTTFRIASGVSRRRSAT